MRRYKGGYEFLTTSTCVAFTRDYYSHIIRWQSGTVALFDDVLGLGRNGVRKKNYGNLTPQVDIMLSYII
jgi:hypothetical protein